MNWRLLDFCNWVLENQSHNLYAGSWLPTLFATPHALWRTLGPAADLLLSLPLSALRRPVASSHEPTRTGS